MRRNDFLKCTAVTVAGGIILPLASCSTRPPSALVESPGVRQNWAGNYTYRADNLYEPTTVEEVQDLVHRLDRQKALGSRHCFNSIADSPENQISTQKLNNMLGLDEARQTVDVQAGARYGDFAEELHARGYALHNLASLPHITVAGACATGTHGSGVTNGNLATSVVSLNLVKADGELVTIDRKHPDFPAVVVGLGAFGVVTRLTLAVQPAFEVRQDVFTDLPLAAVTDHFQAIMSAGYSVSLFTDWMDGKVSEVWIKRRMDAAPDDLGDDFYGARAATENLHPIAGLSNEAVSDQLGRPGPWYDRLPHFRMGFTPSAGKELQSEYFVPRDRAVEALLAIEALRDQIHPHLMISEIRTIAADEFWASPCYQQDSVAIHFTWKPDGPEVMALLPRIEATLEPFGVRPHWGKLFTLEAATLRQRYPRLADFAALADRYDPAGKFRNDFLKQRVFG
ncbi:D-arabinono-1,4-lactone oxidase [Neolewinella litorea]|uniref:FAD-binding protein n=1 Tax=Neolewinella litorea TaxID=2562452 RepID=A0A4S4NC18_9BACT|nr:D-arabinono-1,4-lactone oxidase [Neolewinella litorea]THH35588.1 FAD-binding protein [Neolewinella litorea]